MTAPSGEIRHPFAVDQPPSQRFCKCGHHAIHHPSNVVADLAFPGLQGLVLGACDGGNSDTYCSCSGWRQVPNGGPSKADLLVPKHTHDFRMPRSDGSKGCSYPGCHLYENGGSDDA